MILRQKMAYQRGSNAHHSHSISAVQMRITHTLLNAKWQLLGMRITRKLLCQYKHCNKHAMLAVFSQII